VNNCDKLLRASPKEDHHSLTGLWRQQSRD